MKSPFVPRIGGVFSADIAVPEHEHEMRFYVRVLGTGANPLWREDLMNSLGMPVIGLGQQNAEFSDLPLQWMPHIQVADVAASAKRAVDLGGRELMHARDESGNSQWAVLADPDGAAFGVIPVVPAEAIPGTNSNVSPDTRAGVGCIAWLDLTVPDAEAAQAFYGQVVGWSVQDTGMEDAGEHYTDYCMLGGDGEPAAGICHARGVNRDLPPVWMIYLPVGDLPESLRRVEVEGGRIVRTTQSVSGEAAFAVVQDPVGVYVALVE